MARKPARRHAFRLIVLLTLVSLGMLIVSPVQAQVAFKDADFSGYATGTYLHADALTLGLVGGSQPTIKLDAGFAGASVASKGLTSQVVDKLGRVVSPVANGKNSYGEGFGLDLGLLGNDLLTQQHATAAAPPSTEPVIRRLLGPITIPGVVSAGVLEGRAQATYDPNFCILGRDMSFGSGDAANATVLGGPIESLTAALLGTDPANQDPGAVRSSSRTRLVPQTNRAGQKIGDNLGLMAETKQILAPIVLFQGIPGAELTISVLGEWTMRAVATGIPGQAYIQYMPSGNATGETNVLSIQNTLPAVGEAPLPIVGVTLNQLLGIVPLNDLVGGPGGLLGLGLVKLELNPPPTITEAADGTSATGSVDVARVALLPEGEGLLGQLLGGLSLNVELADVRIGHMEAAARVPAGGIVCPGIAVSKRADPTSVNAGNPFTYTISTGNPYDCDLTGVRLEDKVRVDRGILYRITGSNPPASSTTSDTLVFNDIGPIAPKQFRDVTIGVEVDKNSASGLFHNTATVTSNCGLDTAQGGAKINVPLRGEVTIHLPQVVGAPPLPRTGGRLPWFYTAGALLLAALSGGLLWASRRVRTGAGSG
jgi:hypothetical protein